MRKEKININEVIRSYIDEKGIKITAIANGTKIKYSLLICYLTKGQSIEILDYFSICSFLGVNPTYFVEKLKIRKEI